VPIEGLLQVPVQQSKNLVFNGMIEREPPVAQAVRQTLRSVAARSSWLWCARQRHWTIKYSHISMSNAVDE
jgi:hypothetical protein